MSAATLTTKGQTTIPKDIRDGLGLAPGDQLDFHLLSNSSATIRARRGALKDFVGSDEAQQNVGVEADHLRFSARLSPCLARMVLAMPSSMALRLSGR